MHPGSIETKLRGQLARLPVALIKVWRRHGCLRFTLVLPHKLKLGSSRRMGKWFAAAIKEADALERWHLYR